VIVSGFGVSSGSAHADHIEFIDFTGIGSGATFTYTSGNTSNTSGTLTVSSGGKTASVTLIGTYTSGDFTSSTLNGTIAITDPSTVTNGASVHSANVALFGNYLAGFVAEAGSHGGTVTIDSASAEQPLLLTAPRPGHL